MWSGVGFVPSPGSTGRVGVMSTAAAPTRSRSSDAPVPAQEQRNAARRKLTEEDLDILVEIHVEIALLLLNRGQRHVDDLEPGERNHPPPLPLAHEVDGLQAVARRDQAVERRRRPAALDVAEDGHAGLEAGALFDLLRDPVPDAAQLLVAELVLLAARRRELPADGPRPPRAHADRALPSLLFV